MKQFKKKDDSFTGKLIAPAKSGNPLLQSYFSEIEDLSRYEEVEDGGSDDTLLTRSELNIKVLAQSNP